MDNTQRMRRAIERHQAGDLAEAGRLYKEILDRDPRHSEAWHLSGVIAHQLGRDVEALQLIEHAIGICHDMAVYHANLATVHFSRGDAERAVEACRRALEIDSANAQAMNLLGGLMLDEADRKPAHDKSGREALQAEADRLLTQAARLAPRMADAWSNLCRLHAVRREWDRAEAAGRRAIGLAPRNFQAIRHLAAVLARQSKPEEAARLYEQAIEVRPDVADVRFNFAEMLGQLGRLADAERAYIAAIERDPRHVAAWNNLGHLYMERGGTEQGIACYRRVLEIDPHHTHVRSNYLGALMISGTTTPNELADAHREAGRMMEARATRPIAPTGGVSPRSPIGGGPIRIGYVSPDFRNHAMTSFFEPMLAGHDRQSFAVHCYSSVARPDEVTRRLQSQADAWRDIHLLSDDEAADLVRSDRIDLLVDLAGHTGNHRLGVFARRAAPVQATMLGYMLTTGLASVDAYISDSTRNPPEFDALYTERVVRLSRGCCWRPPSNGPPVNAAPCIERGYVTFGSTHRIDKLTLRTLEVWSRVMNAVRGSRLLVFRNLLKGQPELQVSILERLADCGITPDRVDIAWDTGTEHLPAYHAIDILLDTVPWSAGTTAFESMWMGVPIPAMLGSLPTSRVAAAALDAVGLTEFIAESEDAYVASLEQLASDHAALAALRQTLRPRVEATVGDESGFVREWEATCRELVRR